MKYNSTVLFVQDITKSKQFYTKVLEQKICQDFGLNIAFESGIAIWKIRDEHIIQEKLETTGGNNRLEIYFETEDILTEYNKLASNNVEFLHTIYEESWGQKTIRFFDPDKHLIEIGETIPGFVKRMYLEGMTRKEIALKTGINLEQILVILD